MAAADPARPCAGDARRPLVLIVEDEVVIRMLLAEALRNEGYEVMEAADAEEALVVLQTLASPDLLITDVRMPGRIDGLHLASHVRRTNPSLRVIVTSGHAGAERAQGVADAFLQKPYELGRIMRDVRALTPSP